MSRKTTDASSSLNPPSPGKPPRLDVTTQEDGTLSVTAQVDPDRAVLGTTNKDVLPPARPAAFLNDLDPRPRRGGDADAQGFFPDRTGFDPRPRRGGDSS